ncbi:uncharacterized protein LOC105701675 [Orussus abietinus]|uniref:uncharacterized protein LOC105701675 n=1 Tax=Orussus abietinus TaxID=222816 RepID=UPI000625E44A|nr:uncharacterized protein LOC105701675 [Orussus abietinus]
MEEVDDRPKWMIELENRKRKPRLAHEAGAGSPCLVCQGGCPGLDLHFWRKICKSCKCSRDDHDVNDDDFPQFDILFGPSGTPRKKGRVVLRLDNKKQAAHEMPFDWIPPNTTKELAADYMKALPVEKLPIKDSPGAVLRRQQLQKQLPLHDIDHKSCDELSEQEKKQFEKYLENLKKYVGQGKVTKIMGARPFVQPLMTPINATDMQRFSPHHKANSPIGGQRANLRTPSSFLPKVPTLKSPLLEQNRESHATPVKVETVHGEIGECASGEKLRLGQYHPTLDKISNSGQRMESKLVDTLNQQFASPNRLTSSPSVSKHLNQMETQGTQTPPRTGNHQLRYGTPQAEGMIESVVQNPKLYHEEGAVYTPLPSHSHSLPSRSSASSASLPSDVHPEEKFLRNKQYPPKSSYPSQSVPINTELAESSTDNHGIVPENVANISSVGYSLFTEDDLNQEYSRSAELMLSEALLPPSAVNASDIVGSTLGKDKLMFIQEQLRSKYSKDDPIRMRLAKAQDLESNSTRNTVPRSLFSNTAEKCSPVKVDKEIEQVAIIAAMRNSSGDIAMGESLYGLNHCYSTPLDSKKGHSTEDDKLSGTMGCGSDGNKDLFRDQKGHLIEPNSPYASLGKETITADVNKDEAIHPECSQAAALTGSSEKANSSIHGEPLDNAYSDAEIHQAHQSLPYRHQAELNYQPVHSTVIHSEDLRNPVFPEGVIGTPQIVQNPANIDRLRGAMEELSVGMAPTQKCHRCQESIHIGDVVVTAEKAKNSVWHPGCFVCSTCNELLVDLVYFYYKGKLYCGRDLASLLEIPRCFACDELIFVREYTVAEGHNYHVKHFCCWDCDVPLAGQQYISENDRPLCLLCYQKTYAKTCNTCRNIIEAHQQGVAVKNLDFHAVPECFCCFVCKKSLLNGKMTIREEKPFCSKECVGQFMSEKPR